MLPAELVQARARGSELVVRELKGPRLKAAVEAAASMLAVLPELRGGPWSAVRRAWSELGLTDLDTRTVGALAKLIEQHCELDFPVDPDKVSEVRRAVFARASAQWASLQPEQPFEREAVLREVGEQFGTTPEWVSEALFADLPEARLLKSLPVVGAEALVEELRLAQWQGLLLRGVSLTAQVRCRTGADYRRLLQRLKFRQLLLRVTPLESGGYELAIDGPMSLFGPVTRYGMQLALALPALLDCSELKLEAQIRWGKARRPLTWRYEHARRPRWLGSEPTELQLSDEVSRVLTHYAGGSGPWQVQSAEVLLDMPSEGICVPDLTFTSRTDGRRVHVEFLGYWSRDALWRRVQWAERGLPEPVLFVASSRLRVSEQVLAEDASGALYVYKGVPSARAIEERVALLAARVALPAGAGGAAGQKPARRGSFRRPRT